MKVLFLSFMMSMSAFAGVTAVECELEWEPGVEVTFDFIISDVKENSKVFLTIPGDVEFDDPAQVTPLPILGSEITKKKSTIAVGFFMGALMFTANNKDLKADSGTEITVELGANIEGSESSQEITCLIL